MTSENPSTIRWMGQHVTQKCRYLSAVNEVREHWSQTYNLSNSAKGGSTETLASIEPFKGSLANQPQDGSTDKQHYELFNKQ